mmetsp:Transcript_20832/g.45646  ORF Transcript_20832/g.45646 Transcript_20832/m.45646 type:complete len:339 (-) Transcript_20832:206-1222(-)|eukprot:CAMPEP_0118928400 /NCGR_PEP_ID=MMETSP1169-20130426/5654_1 /TAXON_ID=36882 /ORGANISM="Pyramimonas obovata, Strain CCMP722" /LENGTH=338 /DNA_ID=CAMNT_0006870355 /DNA_START=55 /DNA_END=1071 /DNA_ORIENTATION=-
MATAKTALDEMGSKGDFKRTDSIFRSTITKDGEFPPAKDRYHLYVAYACPWANRALAVLYMKGLQDVIGVSVVHPTWAQTRPNIEGDVHRGWQFVDPEKVKTVTSAQQCGSFSTEGCVPDTVEGCRFVRDLYEITGTPGGKYSVPILWDKQKRTIVNNESAEIIRFLNADFNEFATNPSLDLYPKALRPVIDEINLWTYEINNGVYKCGFATTQEAYDEAEGNLYATMDRAEEHLSTRRYLAGAAFTEADIRLFVTLVRFDEVYVVYFKTNRRCLREYPNLFNYTKDVFQQPGVAASVNMAHIKMHYFTSHEKLNTYAVIPRGPGVDFSSAHDRDRFT